MENTNKKLSSLQRILLLLSAAAIASALFVPIWRIDLDAPQYPEGLSLQIFASRLAGNVDIINGLNHYIGMKTLHTEDFMEFTLLPYILAVYAFATLLTALFGNRRTAGLMLAAFVLFGVVAMVDFWRWEYNYGHDLKPDAAIIVPGMAYQPPLIGFKQLLNFGAFSAPDIGGCLFIFAGVLMVLTVVLPRITRPRYLAIAAPAFAVFLLSSCSHQVQAIRFNKDNCSYCQMTISDRRFAAELISDKGKAYKFDDLACLLNYKSDNKSIKFTAYYVSEYNGIHALIPLESASVLVGEGVGSPMGGNMAAFSNRDSAMVYSVLLGADLKPTNELGR